MSLFERHPEVIAAAARAQNRAALHSAVAREMMPHRVLDKHTIERQNVAAGLYKAARFATGVEQ